MEISEVRVRLVEGRSDRLRAFCTLTLDDVFVIRDLKIVDGSRGLFVAMPSRRTTVSCPRCDYRNHLRAKFCNECGTKLPPNQQPENDEDSRNRMHRDIAHPITPEFRDLVQNLVLQAYEQELAQSEDPNYEPSELDTDADSPEGLSEYDSLIADLRSSRSDGEDNREFRGRRGGSRGRREDGRPGKGRGRGRGESSNERCDERSANRVSERGNGHSEDNSGQRGGHQRRLRDHEKRRERHEEFIAAEEKEEPPVETYNETFVDEIPTESTILESMTTEAKDDEPFGMGLLDEPKRAKTKPALENKWVEEPVSKPAEEAPAEVAAEEIQEEGSDDLADEDAPFGAGIL